MNGNDIFNKPSRRLRSSSTGMVHPAQVDNMRSSLQSIQENETSTAQSNLNQPHYLNSHVIQQYLQVFADKKRNDALLYTTLIGINYIKMKLNGQILHASIPQLQTILSSIEDEVLTIRPNNLPSRSVEQSAQNLQKNLQEKFMQLERRGNEIYQNDNRRNSSQWRNRTDENCDSEIGEELEDNSYSEDDSYQIKRSDLQRRRDRRNSRNTEDLLLQRVKMLEESLQKQQLQTTQQQNYFSQFPMPYFQGSFYPQSPAPSTPNNHSSNQFYTQPGVQPPFNQHTNFYQSYNGHPMQQAQYQQNQQYNQYHTQDDQFNPNTPSNYSTNNGRTPEVVIQKSVPKPISPVVELRTDQEEGEKSKGGMAWSLGGEPQPKKKPEVKKGASDKRKAKKPKETPKEKKIIVKREKYVPPKNFGLPYNTKNTESRIKTQIMISKMQSDTASEGASKTDDVLVLFKPPPGSKETEVFDSKKLDNEHTRTVIRTESEEALTEKKVSFAERSQHIELERTVHEDMVIDTNRKEKNDLKEEIQKRITKEQKVPVRITEKESINRQSVKNNLNNFSSFEPEESSSTVHERALQDLYLQLQRDVISKSKAKISDRKTTDQPIKLPSSQTRKLTDKKLEVQAQTIHMKRDPHIDQREVSHRNAAMVQRSDVKSFDPPPPVSTQVPPPSSQSSVMGITRQFLNNRFMQDFL